MMAGLIAFAMLALKVSGLSTELTQPGYVVMAYFDNVGDLKIRAPVTLGGVRIGQITDIQLDDTNYRAKVSFRINASENKIPEDSSASIFTAGLLGSNYISISPGYDDVFLKEGSTIQSTHSALILENLIGQFLFSINKQDKSEGKSK
ncbi:MAG: outer membrane lipid asymmetry maintenance protein MlaD [Gammaproteobacteria bacterium RIFCSPLOWO2_02_FULL_38_11]|nr:MAG: outer membrane lipid asymmetry maintenance protein MlaD [Gammaproteobacteria bacterium RIFCSPHIGHO2_02_FULL_38_33]OGT24318.1 MAG: outer membrane lipid asymmetry maintenance protein MlaD [Gammaproteobacteria bacterium RIFCSPHIGHO2_12_38_15]OGT67049.1 MAG: outer membrane lipid asymmetry maintenance protein MlaD [Gammaproteobacteria bacterium RIFCSPLOWO2_02_FULL_38_11]OGT77504.1 MAG: outer membrane lipid asymmetry maintenance protein MlaD [Gammaproteobacteria bacterium RIFCSPLOWO2_12_FULL_3